MKTAISAPNSTMIHYSMSEMRRRRQVGLMDSIPRWIEAEMKIDSRGQPSNRCPRCKQPLPKLFKCGAPAKKNSYREAHPCEIMVRRRGEKCAVHTYAKNTTVSGVKY